MKLCFHKVGKSDAHTTPLFANSVPYYDTVIHCTPKNQVFCYYYENVNRAVPTVVGTDHPTNQLTSTKIYTTMNENA